MDIVPDRNFIESELSCNDNYYCDQEFNDFISLSNVSGRLSIRHLNIRSINKNMDNLLMLLHMLKHKFSVIAIIEAWETATNTNLSR